MTSWPLRVGWALLALSPTTVPARADVVCLSDRCLVDPAVDGACRALAVDGYVLVGRAALHKDGRGQCAVVNLDREFDRLRERLAK